MDKHLKLKALEIAVIAWGVGIGIVIIAPLFARGREHTPQSRCISHQMQIAKQVWIYADEHHRYPPAQSFWTDIDIADRLKHCGAASDRANAYGVNASICGKADDEIADPAHPTEIYPDTIHLLLAADSDNPTNLLHSRYDLAPRHEGSFVCVFMDGHARSMPDRFSSSFVLITVPREGRDVTGR